MGFCTLDGSALLSKKSVMLTRLERRTTWLPGRDSNPDTQDQNLMSYH